MNISPLLYPFALLYGVGVGLRNFCYNHGLFRSRWYREIPTICIGNVALGGTGKTPHTEFLIRKLSQKYKVAMLSRGYKRKTKGFLLATPQSTSVEIGDEPCQVKQKFPHCIVAVDANRNRGIQRLLSLPKKECPELILLDDAFQHRAVKPTFSILLTKYSRLYVDDHLVPVGTLRDEKSSAQRADVVIVTKCPQSVKTIDLQRVAQHLALLPMQHLFFSQICYDEIQPIFPEFVDTPQRIDSDTHVLLVAGIESPEFMIKEVQRQTPHVSSIIYPDHYVLSTKDYQQVDAHWQKIPPQKRMLLLSEKDAARLKDDSRLPSTWKGELYYLPIRISLLQDREDEFLQLIEKQLIINSTR